MRQGLVQKMYQLQPCLSCSPGGISGNVLCDFLCDFPCTQKFDNMRAECAFLSTLFCALFHSCHCRPFMILKQCIVNIMILKQCIMNIMVLKQCIVNINMLNIDFKESHSIIYRLNAESHSSHLIMLILL